MFLYQVGSVFATKSRVDEQQCSSQREKVLSIQKKTYECRWHSYSLYKCSNACLRLAKRNCVSVVPSSVGMVVCSGETVITVPAVLRLFFFGLCGLSLTFLQILETHTFKHVFCHRPGVCRASRMLDQAWCNSQEWKRDEGETHSKRKAIGETWSRRRFWRKAAGAAPGRRRVADMAGINTAGGGGTRLLGNHEELPVHV